MRSAVLRDKYGVEVLFRFTCRQKNVNALGCTIIGCTSKRGDTVFIFFA